MSCSELEWAGVGWSERVQVIRMSRESRLLPLHQPLLPRARDPDDGPDRPRVVCRSENAAVL